MFIEYYHYSMMSFERLSIFPVAEGGEFAFDREGILRKISSRDRPTISVVVLRNYQWESGSSRKGVEQSVLSFIQNDLTCDPFL